MSHNVPLLIAALMAASMLEAVALAIDAAAEKRRRKRLAGDS